MWRADLDNDAGRSLVKLRPRWPAVGGVVTGRDAGDRLGEEHLDGHKAQVFCAVLAWSPFRFAR